MKKFLFLLIFFAPFFFTTSAFAAGCAGTGSCFWVGGTGNSSDTAHWATASGGATTGSIPTATDDCTFDSLSNATAYTYTVDAATACKSFVMGAPLTGAITWAGSSGLNVKGSMNLSGGTAGITRTYTGLITFSATSGTITINSNSVVLVGSITFNGAGGTFQLTSDFNVLSSGTTWTLTAGTFDANSRAVIMGGGASAVTIQGNATTFYDLTLNGGASKTGGFTFSNNPTVTHTFTISGNSVTNRALIQSNTIGTARTITAAAVSVSNADFQDITGAGAATWDLSLASGGSGDCGGNSMQALGIAAFTTATTSYWAASYGGNWSGTGTTLNWTPTQGGATTTNPGRVPLCQDDAKMNLVFGISKTVTADMPRLGKNIDWTGATWTTSLFFVSSINQAIYGSLTLINGLSYSDAVTNLTMRGRGSFTISCNGVLIDQNQFIITAPGGTYTLGSDFFTNQLLFITQGTFTVGASNYAISTGTMTIGGGTLTLGTATHLLTLAGTAWNFSSGVMNANTSTLKFTDTTNSTLFFSGGSGTFNNVWFNRGASTGSISLTGSNLFNDFKDTGTAAHSLLFTAGTTQTVSTFTVVGNGAGNEISINTVGMTTTHALTKTGGGTISSDFLNIQHSVATPSSTWYAGANSINNQGVSTVGSGWIFTVPPVISSTFNPMFFFAF